MKKYRWFAHVRKKYHIFWSDRIIEDVLEAHRTSPHKISIAFPLDSFKQLQATRMNTVWCCFRQFRPSNSSWLGFLWWIPTARESVQIYDEVKLNTFSLGSIENHDPKTKTEDPLKNEVPLENEEPLEKKKKKKKKGNRWKYVNSTFLSTFVS